MSYIDGFVIAVPTANKQKFIEHARHFDPLFIELGAIRVIEGWGDDVPDGKVTDFRRAVQATAEETVAFAWVEWPDKATRDAAMKKMVGRPAHGPVHTRQSSHALRRQAHDLWRLRTGGRSEGLNGGATPHLDVGRATAGVWRRPWAPRQVVPGWRASYPFRLQLVPHPRPRRCKTDRCRAPISGQRMSAEGRQPGAEPTTLSGSQPR